jgi:glycine cleavage system pyridoxal-binding protein P
MDNRTDFLKNVGLLFTLTDGFKNLDGLVKGKVNKEVKRGLRELENTINNTQRTSDGNLKLVSGMNDDPESFIGKGYKLDI